MSLIMERYQEQEPKWPTKGRHILAQYTPETVAVYQAYRPAIGRFAAEHGRFGGEFSLERMSWIKPNFLWMMYRSGWGTKPGQEVILAVHLKRGFFDRLLKEAVASAFGQSHVEDKDEWQRRVRSSSVRLQWDPDHTPTGGKRERRAIQLGLRNEVLREYAGDALVEIEDISGFVAEQRENTRELARLITPSERVYPVSEPETARTLGMG